MIGHIRRRGFGSLALLVALTFATAGGCGGPSGEVVKDEDTTPRTVEQQTADTKKLMEMKGGYNSKRAPGM